MTDSALSRPAAPCGGQWSLVPADGGVDGSNGRRGAAHAHRPVFPVKVSGVEHPPQTVMNISAFGHGHEAGGALVQPVYHMENEIAPRR